jgi:hypothetical protein
MSVTKAKVLEEVLRLAKAKQGKEKEPCVELTASTSLEALPRLLQKNSLIDDVTKTLAGKYDVTFPTDVRTLGTIDGVAEYIVENTDR